MQKNIMKKYYAVYSLGFENALEYRGNYLINLISIFFPILMQYFVWTAIFAGKPSNAVMFGLTYAQAIIYTLCAGFIAKLVSTGCHYQISQDIKNGTLNQFLVQPVKYIIYQVFRSIGEKTLELVIVFVVMFIFALVIAPTMGLKLTIYGIVMFLIALIPGIVLNFLMFLSVSMIAFWIIEVGRLYTIIDILVAIVSGSIFPLSIFGDKAGWICSHLLYLMVLYASDISIGGLNKDSLFLFVGTYLVITGIYMGMFFTNFYNIPEYIRTGQLDLFITTLRYVDFGYPVADFVAGIALIVIGWNRMGVNLSIGNVTGFIGFIILGVIWVYVLQLVPALLSFWTVKVSGVYSIGYAVHDMNKMPRAVYGKLIQRIGTFIYPLFPMANYGTLFVTGKLQSTELVWGLVGPFIFLALSIGFWNLAVRRYVSASS